MAEKWTDLDGAKRGAAILAVCIVQTLNERTPGFQDSFLQNLKDAQIVMKDTDTDLEHELDVLAWDSAIS